MLKLFRLYGKWMLPIAMSFLMVAFLVTGFQGKDNPKESTAVIGRLAGGRKLTMKDRLAAKTDLDVLEKLVGDPALLQGESAPDEGDRGEASANRWMLIQAEADRLGVDVSEGEINSALFVVDRDRKDGETKSFDAAMASLMTSTGANDAALRQALRSYLRAEGVRQLASGDALEQVDGVASPGLKRLRMLPVLQQQAMQSQQQAYIGMMMSQTPQEREKAQRDFQRANLQAKRLLAVANGTQRFSTPLLAHQLQDLNAVVSGRLVVVPGIAPGRTGAQPEPTEAQLKELFEPLKDSPRGSAPNGFGYRLPPRFKIEALVIPMAEALKAAQASVTEDQVRDWFDAHPDHFVAKDAKDAKPGDAPALTADNRKKAREELLADTARAKALEFARTCELALATDLRLAAANGDRLPAGTAPTPLKAAADAVKAKHGFDPVLLTPAQIETEALAALSKDAKIPPLATPGAAEAWMTPSELLAHPILGRAKLEEQSGVLLPQTANHLAGGPEDRRLPEMKLGVNLRLPVARAQDGACILARITEVSAPRAAASVDEVKVQLARDARELAAFRELAAHTKELCANAAAAKGLDKFASDTDRLFAVPALTRVDASGSTAPAIDGVGSSEPLVKAVFGRAEALRQTPGGVAGANLEDRLVAVPLDSLCAIVLFELQDYAPIPKSRAEELSRNIFSRFSAHTATLGSAKSADPLSETALKARLGWEAK